MSQYKLHQISLTQEDADFVNGRGWTVAALQNPKIHAYVTMTLAFTDGQVPADYRPSMFKHYTHVCDIEADSLNEVFKISNIGPDSAITRHASMTSGAVGNLIEDDQGRFYLICAFGFAKIYVDKNA